MKQLWAIWSTRIDALTLRERTMVFASALAGLVFLSYTFGLGPLFERQERHAEAINSQHHQIAIVDQKISALLVASQKDPDAANRMRLEELTAETELLGSKLRNMRESLVAPEKMVPLLETLLRSNSRLRLVTLRTLPVAGLNDPTVSASRQAGIESQGEATDAASIAARTPDKSVPATPPTAAQVAQLPDLVYRHGVEITLQGRYLDMVNYLTQLESLPVRLIWGRAQLNAKDHPDLQLTLILYTLSLDREWMKL